MISTGFVYSTMKEISFALNVAILLDIIGKRLCFGHEMALQQNDSRFALFHKVEEGMLDNNNSLKLTLTNA